MGRLTDDQDPDLAAGEQLAAALGEYLDRRRRFGVLGVEVMQEPGDFAAVIGGRDADGQLAEVGSGGANRLTNSRAVEQTSCQPESIVSEWPRFGIFAISVTAELRLCLL